jgi:hypothetical protein
MDAHLLKSVMFPALAVGSAAALWMAMGKPWETRFLKTAVIGAVFVKFAGCVLLYTLAPDLIRYSDARTFYLPQTLQLLSGDIPNRDFASSYSLLFTPLLAIPVKLWASPGSIVLAMILVETAMIWIYVGRCRGKAAPDGWRVAFLYAVSPFSFYWIAISGHNSILIAFWVMLALVSAEKGRATLSGIAAALGFLTAKILALLAWPGLILFDRGKRWARALPMGVSLAAVAGLTLAGIDSISPLRAEMQTATRGNLWHIIGAIAPGAGEAAAWPYLPIGVFAAVFIPLCALYFRSQESGNRFDKTAAFVAATFLLFLAVSRKGYSTYLIMALPFVVHTIAHGARGSAAGGRLRLALPMLPLVFLGAVGFIEEFHGGGLGRLLLVHGLRIVAYVFLAAFCFAASIRETVGEK